VARIIDGKPATDNVVIPSSFFTDDVMNKAFADAQDMMVRAGVDINTHPFFGKMNSDPLYREISMKKIQSDLNKATIDQIVSGIQAKATKN
jgi:hypothetical protein